MRAIACSSTLDRGAPPAPVLATLHMYREWSEMRKPSSRTHTSPEGELYAPPLLPPVSLGTLSGDRAHPWQPVGAE